MINNIINKIEEHFQFRISKKIIEKCNCNLSPLIHWLILFLFNE